MASTLDRALSLLAARELVAARSLLRQGAEAGDPDAAAIEIALTANGSGGPADWEGARRLLAAASGRFGAPFAQQDRLLAELDLTREGYPACPPAGELLEETIGLRRFVGFLSPAECAIVAQAASTALAPSEVIDPHSGEARPHPVRLSSEAVIGPTREHLVVQTIVRRIALASGTQLQQGEPLTVLHYAPGQQYRPHLDTLPATRNQRQRTFIIYLNDAYEGGETAFPELGITVAPRAGDAIMFDTCDAAGRPDPRARHAGMPVATGAKWIATRWIRQRPYDVWRGPEAV